VFQRFLPKPETSDKCVSVLACSTTRRQLFEIFNVSSTKNDVLGDEGFDESSDNVGDALPPSLLS